MKKNLKNTYFSKSELYQTVRHDLNEKKKK